MDFSLLSKYKISFPSTHLAASMDESVQTARKFGFPIAMKVVSPSVLHKSDRGGVMLDIKSAAEAEKAYRLLMERYRGVKIDGVLVQKMAGASTSGVGEGGAAVQAGKDGVELIVGGKRDAQFGSLIMLGLGGIFVEVMKDVTFRVCPITESDATAMIHELKSYPILAGARGRKPINERALVATLMKVSHLLEKENPKEFDINPLIADSQGCTAVDMRIIR